MRFLPMLLVAVAALALAAPAPAGVLIGRQPEKKDAADIRDLSWQIEGDTIRLTLVAAGPNGTTVEHRYPPLSKALVRQALRYAVDARPLTVTMITAEPLHELKIVLHPALVDTPLGRHAIRLDQFADEFAAGVPARKAARERYAEEMALYKLAWAARAKVLLPAVQALARPRGARGDADREDGIAAEFKALAGLADEWADNPELKRLAVRTLTRAQRADGGTIWAAKGEFFDPALVEAITPQKPSDALVPIVLKRITTRAEESAKELRDAHAAADKWNEKVKAFKARAKVLDADIVAFNRDALLNPGGLAMRSRKDALEERQRKVAANGRELDAEKKRLEAGEQATQAALKAVLIPPPEATIWSGVRERPYAGVVADYVLPEKPGAERPFRFMEQVAWTGAPMFLKDKGEIEDYTDEKPFEFADAETAMNAAVTAALGRNPAARLVADDMAAFTVVQRMARAGLNGHLGGKFPADRLTALAKALGAPAASDGARTARWRVSPNSLEVTGLRTLAKALDVPEGELKEFTTNLELLQLLGRRVDLTEAVAPLVKAIRKRVAELTKDESKKPEAVALGAAADLLSDALTARCGHDAVLRKITAGEDAHAALLLAPGAHPTGVGLLAAARVRAWDEYEKAHDEWVKKWAEAVKWEAPAWAAAKGTQKAALVLAHLDYAIQTRHKMRVIDDERQLDFQSRDR